MSLKIKYPIYKPVFQGNEKKYLINCIDTGWISSLGSYIKKFENKFTRYCGRKYGLACINGTAALHLALACLGIKEGDEVIIPDSTFIATANAVKYLNAVPVPAEVRLDTWNIDETLIEKVITRKTKAVVVVHLYGCPAEMDKIGNVCRKHGLFLIEDAAQSHGAFYKGRKTGSFGDISCFSFYGNKVITTGEGGIVITDRKKYYDIMNRLRDHNMDMKRRYWHFGLGYNYRITNLQAAVGLGQFEGIDEILKQKKRVTDLYFKYLKDVEELQLPYMFDSEETVNIVWLFNIVLQNTIKKKARHLAEYLRRYGIDSRPFFVPIHKQPLYRDKKYKTEFKNSIFLSERGLNIPSYITLTEKEIKYICSKIKKFVIAN